MIVYKDVFTGDEMISDSYDVKEIFDGACLEVACKMVKVGGEDYGLEDNTGEEEGGGGLDDAVETVNDIVNAFRLSETPYGKKDFQIYIKGYMKKVKTYLAEKNPDRVEGFMKDATTVVKAILKDFKNYQFFLGESMEPEAGLGFLFYKEDGIIPYMMYFKDGLLEEKC